MASRQAEWAERVRRCRQSGLSARAFAESIGVKSGSLTHWAWRLGREQTGRRAARRRAAPRGAAPARFVELLTEALDAPHFELVLSNGRRLHIPARFEAAALERLLAVLENGAVIPGGVRIFVCTTLRSTTAIENLNGSIATYTRNVKRWRNGQMVLRWVGAALHEASVHFRRVRGYRELPILIAAHAKLDKKTKKAA